MSDETFDALVERLEESARRGPGGYKLRVLALSLLGYGYVLAMLALLVALMAVLLRFTRTMPSGVVKLELFLLVLVGVVLRALWVRFEPPTGMPLGRERAPRLFAELDRLRAALDAPRLHRVLLTPDFNAAIAQVPRLGALGWHRNYLLVGLPLLQGLSPEEVRAVLAHEWGHLSRTHGRFTTWVYRIRSTWLRLVEELENRGHAGRFLFTRFFAWFAPLYEAYTFVLARAMEYEADQQAARLAGAGALAAALVRLHVVGDRVGEELWPAIHQRAAAEPEPPAALNTLATALRSPADREADVRRLDTALAERRASHDTHPALGERLAALGQEPRLPAPPAETAADHYLGAELPDLTAALDKQWREEVGPGWRHRHEEAAQERRRLAELEEKAAAGELDVEELWERARLTGSVGDEAAAAALLREVLAREPGHAGASFALGASLLAEEPEGAILLETAAADPHYALLASQLLAGFWESRGEEEKARHWEGRVEEAAVRMESAWRERNTLEQTDVLFDHDLPETVVADLAEQLAAHPEVKAAFLARKAVEVFPDRPLYVLGIELPWFRTEEYDQRRCQRVAEAVILPGKFLVISVTTSGRIGKELRRRPGAQVYSRASTRRRSRTA